MGSNVWLRRTPEDYNNETPSVVMSRLGGISPQSSPQVSDRYSFTIYGGRDLSKNYSENLPEAVFSALQDRSDLANNTKTDMGIVGSFILESGQQNIDSEDGRPIWPTVICFGRINAI